MLKLNGDYQMQLALDVPKLFGVEWPELAEAGANVYDGGAPKLQTEEDQVLYGRALAHVLAKHLGKPEPFPFDHPFAGSCLFLGRDGQWGWALRSGYETLQICTGVSRYADEAMEELVREISEGLEKLRSKHTLTDFVAGDRVRHFATGKLGEVEGFRLSFVCVKWDSGERSDFFPEGLYKI